MKTRATQTKHYTDEIFPSIDAVKGFLIKGQERWLYNKVLSLPDDAVVVEIGSFLGRSTTAMAFACQGSKKTIYAIDTFKGNSSDFIKGENNISWEGDDYLETFCQNLRANNLLDHVTPLQGLSREIGKNWDKPIDFLFIDGSHVYEDVICDFELFGPWVKSGSFVALHDVQPQWEGPYKAWHDVVCGSLFNTGHFFSIAYGRSLNVSCTNNVHVIVPVHNRWSLTAHCLRTLKQQTVYDCMRIYVIDDGSTDGTREKLAAEYPEVNIIDGDGNLWWTGAVAKALQIIKPTFASQDYFLLINNDALLSPETVEVLIRESKLLTGASGRASVAPIAIGEDCDAISTGWGPHTAPILNNFERQFDQIIKKQQSLKVESLFGRCSLYPVEILDKVNNFDADAFPHYFGDTDFCLTAGKLGYKNFYVTSSTCIKVNESKASTGSHYDFRKGPQSIKRVKENMTSIKSIDNLKYSWRYMSKHHYHTRFRKTLRVFWRSLSQWTPIYKLRETFRAIKK